MTAIKVRFPTQRQLNYTFGEACKQLNIGERISSVLCTHVSKSRHSGVIPKQPSIGVKYCKVDEKASLKVSLAKEKLLEHTHKNITDNHDAD